jgi:hypothetical protein
MKSLPYTKHDLEILAYVFDGPVTFAYLAQKIHGFGGEYEIAGASNLIIWSDMSDEHSTAVLRLVREQAIAYEIVDRSVYVEDGAVLTYPEAKRLPKGGYKHPHWIPLVIKRGRNL